MDLFFGFKWVQRSLTRRNQIVKAMFIIVMEETFGERQEPNDSVIARRTVCKSGSE